MEFFFARLYVLKERIIMAVLFSYFATKFTSKQVKKITSKIQTDNQNTMKSVPNLKKIDLRFQQKKKWKYEHKKIRPRNCESN